LLIEGDDFYGHILIVINLPSQVLDFSEEIKPIEQHGFTLVDFTKDKMVLSFFK